MRQLLRKSRISSKTHASFEASALSSSKERFLPFSKGEWPFLQDQRFQRNLKVQGLPAHSYILFHPRSQGITPSLSESWLRHGTLIRLKFSLVQNSDTLKIKSWVWSSALSALLLQEMRSI